MFARPNSQHCQVAYVTNDLAAAIAKLKAEYDTPGFFEFSNLQPGEDPTGKPQLKIALANVGGVEIELIEPIGDTAPLYAEALPKGDGLAIRFHHVAIRIDGGIENWDAHIASLDLVRHPIVTEGALGDMLRYIYTDERETLGHYVEHVWLSPELRAQMLVTVPTYPAPAESPV